MKNKKIYISLLLWIFPAYLVITSSKFTWQAIVITLLVTIIVNLDKFKSIGYGDIHAILNDADEKIKTMEELSEMMFIEKVKSLFSNGLSYKLLNPKEYETTNKVDNYFEVIDLYEELNLKKLKKYTYQKLDEYKKQAVEEVRNRLLLSIEYNTLSEDEKNSDLIPVKTEMSAKYQPKIDIIFQDMLNRGIIDIEYGRIIRDQIIKAENADPLLLHDWNLAMHDLSQIDNASKRLE